MQPRKSFQASGKAAEFKKIAASESFEVACEYAFLQLASEMPPTTTPSLPTDPYVAIDANGQMHGAARVLEILRTIADPVKEPELLKRDSLHY